MAAGDLLSYSISVINNGPDGATGVSLGDYISYKTTVVSWAQDSGPDFALSGCCAYGSVFADGGTLAAGQSATFRLVVRVQADVAAGTELQNNASVHSNAFDPVPDNGRAIATTQVIAPAP